jgi:hypothetical protein
MEMKDQIKFQIVNIASIATMILTASAFGVLIAKAVQVDPKIPDLFSIFTGIAAFAVFVNIYGKLNLVYKMHRGERDSMVEQMIKLTGENAVMKVVLDKHNIEMPTSKDEFMRLVKGTAIEPTTKH